MSKQIIEEHIDPLPSCTNHTEMFILFWLCLMFALDRENLDNYNTSFRAVRTRPLFPPMHEKRNMHKRENQVVWPFTVVSESPTMTLSLRIKVDICSYFFKNVLFSLKNGINTKINNQAYEHLYTQGEKPWPGTLGDRK